MTRIPYEGDGQPCAHCHRPATGLAMRNDDRLCHGDGCDCYQQVTVYGRPLGQPCDHRRPMFCKCHVPDPETVWRVLQSRPAPTLMTPEEWAERVPDRPYPGGHL